LDVLGKDEGNRVLAVEGDKARLHTGQLTGDQRVTRTGSSGACVPASAAGPASSFLAIPRPVGRAVSVRWRGVMKLWHHVLHELDKNGTFVIAVLCVLFFLYLLKSDGDDR